MEHLPNGGNGPRIKVPFFGKPYEGGIFLDYPRSQGLNFDHKGQFVALRSKHHYDLNGFLQSWLFFGLLENIMGMHIQAADFVYRDSCGSEYITTAKLLDYFKLWKRRDYTRKECEKQEILRITTPQLRKAYSVVSNLLMQSGADNEVDSDLLLSLQLIGQALTTARLPLYLGAVQTAQERESLFLKWGNSSLMRAHMIESGWCRSLVAAIHAKTIDVQFFASSLKPSKAHKDHTTCSERKCLANEISEDGYVVKHTSEDCQCPDVSPDVNILVSLIRAGRTPLINLSDRSILAYAMVEPMQLVAHESDMPYIAISHVWKDGLGNPHHNALPICQITWLSNRVHTKLLASKNN